MSHREKNLWNTLRDKMRGRWLEATRHEDAYSSGIADVSFVVPHAFETKTHPPGRHGWMELKCLDEWPVRPTTKVRIEHFTVDQKAWLQKKGRMGGDTWFFLRVANDYMLFSWDRIEPIGELTEAELRAHSNVCWWRTVNYDEFLAVLQKGC